MEKKQKENNTKNTNSTKSNASKTKAKNKSTKKIYVIIAIIVIIIIIAVIISAIGKNNSSEENNLQNSNTNTTGYVEEIESGVKLNTSSKLNEAKEVDGLKFANIQLTTKSGITTLLADVTNNTGSSTKLKNVTITLLDQDGNTLTNLKGVVSAMDKGETVQLNVATTSDYINAYDFKVSID